ncbi:hypothetical protein BOTBODRAFT_48507 [Botryobasidium botryosum FD-172 SS1]|uniref:Protein kinase domain-containing protein n=1 Tax=Botryobasidium botryosum (strain FD-172 SS1) TaxID=930990 RepID=A0A067LX44_BOTB1|nr:hypothetical protein BOTBODRAFT_48507 [Botryobasidium botryosum FD-172 SS1]
MAHDQISVRQMLLSLHIPAAPKLVDTTATAHTTSYNPILLPPDNERICRIIHDPDLIQKMHNGLADILATHPKNPSSAFISAETRAEVQSDFQAVVNRALARGNTTTEMSTRLISACRLALKKLEPAGPPLPWENKSWANSDAYIPQIVNLGTADGGHGSPFVFTTSMRDEYAIIARLSLAMVSCKRVRFGVLFSGRQMLILHVRRSPRPYLVVSDPIDLTATDPSPVQLMFYMLLVRSSDSPPLPRSHTEEIITPPPSTVMGNSRSTTARLNAPLDQGESSVNAAPTSSVTSEQLQMCPEISLQFDIVGVSDSPAYNLARSEPINPAYETSPNAPPISWFANGSFKTDNVIKTLVLSQQLRGGACGSVFVGSAQDGAQVVAKFAHEDSIPRVLAEAYFYQNQLKLLQGSVVPRHYGVFSGAGRVVLLIAYAGKPLRSFESLDAKAKRAILGQIMLLHLHGVCHGDVRPDNITMGHDGHPRVIDFSHASVHTCPGVDKCQEIIELARTLELTDILSSYQALETGAGPVEEIVRWEWCRHRGKKRSYALGHRAPIRVSHEWAHQELHPANHALGGA